MSEEEIRADSNDARRKVTLSQRVKVVFEDVSTGASETVDASRDVYSVMEAVMAKLAAQPSKEAVDAIRVSVHSVEDPALSEPVPEGEEPFEGPYMVGGAEIESVPIDEAVKALAALVIPSEYALKNMEALCGQLFVRTRMDGCVFVVSSDGTGMSTTLLNSLRETNPKSVRALYRTLLRAARELRESVERNMPSLGVDFDSDDSSGMKVSDGKGLVLPSGLPASLKEKGVVTPAEIRAAGPKMVRLY